jgi:hypothetical protein
MNNKFGSLAADVSKPFRVELIDPTTEDVIRDKVGKASYIDVWSTDGEVARNYGKAQRKDLNLRIKQSRNGKVEQNDQLEENIAITAVVTSGWYLVDRLTGEALDVPCTAENAADLYSPPGMGWIFVQAFTGASSAANFLQKPSKTFAPTPTPSSEQVAS